jgi:hypothetical protein
MQVPVGKEKIFKIPLHYSFKRYNDHKTPHSYYPIRGSINTLEEDTMPEEKKPKEVGIKITDEILRGVYANNMVVAHTKEEFFVDFINVIPPQGIVTARVIISPGHMKRIIKALSENVRKYEAKFGEIAEAPEPKHVASA